MRSEPLVGRVPVGVGVGVGGVPVTVSEGDGLAGEVGDEGAVDDGGGGGVSVAIFGVFVGGGVNAPVGIGGIVAESAIVGSGVAVGPWALGGTTPEAISWPTRTPAAANQSPTVRTSAR